MYLQHYNILAALGIYVHGHVATARLLLKSPPSTPPDVGSTSAARKQKHPPVQCREACDAPAFPKHSFVTSLCFVENAHRVSLDQTKAVVIL